MSNTTVFKILNELKKNQTIEVCGWVKTFRANRFIALNDGSCLENIQCVIDFENKNFIPIEFPKKRENYKFFLLK